MLGDEITDPDELLFRQIHPSFIENGEPSSQPFRPTPKDRDLLSVDRSALTSASASFDLFIQNGYQSAAVYGVTAVEFNDESISCHSDPIPDTDDARGNPAHAVASYQTLNESKKRLVAKRIKAKALARGKLHP